MPAHTKHRLSPEEKSAIARAWVESVRRNNPETQADFCRRHRLSSPRLLRSWVRRYVPAARWEPELRQAVKAAIVALDNITEVMDRPADGPLGNPQQPQTPEAAPAASATTGARFSFDDEEGDS